MKLIKSSLLVAIGLCTTALVHAQELQTKIAPETEIKTQPAADANNKPSARPELKPMNGIEAKQAPVKAAETHNSAAKDKNSQKPQEPKPAAVAVTDVQVEKPVFFPVPGPVVIKEQ